MKPGTRVISGRALLGEELAQEPVDIVIENGTIRAIEDNKKAASIWICPAFFNSHTHLGDTIAMDAGATGDLESLVAPPYGLKHRLLAGTPRAGLVQGMRASIRDMIRRGCSGCADFREGGPDGLAALNEAARGLPFMPVIFGRDGGEKTGHGIGISSARDVPDAPALVEKAKKLGKKVAFHAGERDSRDVDQALACDPDFIVHATHATRRQLRECADREIPMVICPRSNWALGVTASAQNPPVTLMQELGCKILLGTDNAMFVPPDMLSEMAFTHAVYQTDPGDLIRMAVAGSALAGRSFFIRKGMRANFFVLDPGKSALFYSRNPVATIIKRASFGTIGKNVFNL